MGVKTKYVQYESLIPGLQLSVKKLPHNLVFSAGAPGPDRRGYLTTDDKTIQEIIESHARFKEGIIRRVPTAEEIEEAKIKAEQAKRKQTLKEFYSTLGAMPDFSNLKDEQVYKLAELLGVETSTKDGNKRSKNAILKDIQQIIE